MLFALYTKSNPQKYVLFKLLKRECLPIEIGRFVLVLLSLKYACKKRSSLLNFQGQDTPEVFVRGQCTMQVPGLA
jgi:hypothetical protein